MSNKYSKILKERAKHGDSGYIELYCVECGDKIYTEQMIRWGRERHDTRNGSIDTHLYCNKEECLNKERIDAPKKYLNCIILEDNVNYVVASYQYGNGDSQITNRKRCHWTSKGRYITIKGKRVYI